MLCLKITPVSSMYYWSSGKIMDLTVEKNTLQLKIRLNLLNVICLQSKVMMTSAHIECHKMSFTESVFQNTGLLSLSSHGDFKSNEEGLYTRSYSSDVNLNCVTLIY